MGFSSAYLLKGSHPYWLDWCFVSNNNLPSIVWPYGILPKFPKPIFIVSSIIFNKLKLFYYLLTYL